jgi:hypothetical protein
VRSAGQAEPGAPCPVRDHGIGSPQRPIRAVLVFYDPDDWYRDLQLILDVVISGICLSARLTGAVTCSSSWTPLSRVYVCLSVCLTVTATCSSSSTSSSRVSVCLSDWCRDLQLTLDIVVLGICLPVSVRPSVILAACLPAVLPFCLSVCLPRVPGPHGGLWMPFCLSVCLSACLGSRGAVWLPFCLSVCPAAVMLSVP